MIIQGNEGLNFVAPILGEYVDSVVIAAVRYFACWTYANLPQDCVAVDNLVNCSTLELENANLVPASTISNVSVIASSISVDSFSCFILANRWTVTASHVMWDGYAIIYFDNFILIMF